MLENDKHTPEQARPQRQCHDGTNPLKEPALTQVGIIMPSDGVRTS